MTNEVDLDTETDQQLVDRLVHAAEEEDLLYVEVCVRRLLERGVIDAVTRQHSWKGVSALVLIATRPHSKLSQLIFQVLLLRLNTSVHSAFLGVDLHSWSKNIIVSWERRWRYDARQAVEISGLSDESAVAGWLDAAMSAGELPNPPNLQNLTGCGPLPPRPRFARKTSINADSAVPPTPTSPVRPRASTARSVGVEEEDAGLPSPSSGGSAAFGLQACSSGQSALSDDRPVDSAATSCAAPCPIPGAAAKAKDHPIRIRVGNLPGSVSAYEVIQLFQWAGLRAADLRLVSRRSNRQTDAYVTLPDRTSWQTALRCLDNYPYGNSYLSLDRDDPSFRSSPQEQLTHPTVHVEGLRPYTTANEVLNLARRTKTGVYDATATLVAREGQLCTRGSFRTSSPLAATEAVLKLHGTADPDGRSLIAWWEPAAGTTCAPPTASLGPVTAVPSVVMVQTKREEDDGEAPMDFGSSQEEEEEKQPAAASPEYQPSPSPPSAPPSPTSPSTPFRSPYLATKPLPHQPSSPPPAPQSPPPPLSSPSPAPQNRLDLAASPFPSPLTCTNETDNSFAGVLSPRRLSPPHSSSTSTSSSHLFIPKTRPPSRSTPSPFLPGQGPAIRRPSAMKRGAGEMIGGAGAGGEGGEGEKKKKVRKVSFAD